MNIWELLYETRRRARLIQCLLVGHDVQHDLSPYRLPDVCDRCWFSEEEINLEGATIPNLLCGAYCGLCDRDWHWFNVLDEWLYSKLRRWFKMPRWWEY